MGGLIRDNVGMLGTGSSSWIETRANLGSLSTSSAWQEVALVEQDPGNARLSTKECAYGLRPQRRPC
jgi:hypothetical protein